jgi:hypothetical protein
MIALISGYWDGIVASCGVKIIEKKRVAIGQLKPSLGLIIEL